MHICNIHLTAISNKRSESVRFYIKQLLFLLLTDDFLLKNMVQVSSHNKHSLQALINFREKSFHSKALLAWSRFLIIWHRPICTSLHI